MIEILITVALVTVVMTMVVPPVSRARERAAVRGAVTETVALLSQTRSLAIARRSLITAHFNTTDGSVTIADGPDTVIVRNLRVVHGVVLSANRSSISYGPTGRGYGAANASIILRRGSAADTVITSRLGRVRYR